jgi:hypothetical protein
MLSRSSRHLGVAAFALSLACPVHAAPLELKRGVGSLPELSQTELSSQDRNALGATALAIHPQDWKHAETDHFIYHFVHSYVATPVAVEAEFYWRVAAQELGRPETQDKSHIYIFERPDDWKQFQAGAVLEPWTGGIQSDGSLFIVRDPSFKFADNSLGHEIVHLVLYRFYGRGIPLWLNEGVAEFVSKGAHASFQRARGYLAKAKSQPIPPEQLFPISTLGTMTYPKADRIETFYGESEKLVRFLAAADKPQFLALLELIARGAPFDRALGQTYPTRFPNIASLEEAFRAYAAKDLGSTLQTQ